MTEPQGPAAHPAGPPRWLRLAALGGPLALVVTLGVVYAAGGFGKAEPVACQAAAATAARLKSLAKGEVAALALSSSGQLAPALAFTGPDGKPATLADFRGRTVLLNLWATWCVPCRKEMPALDALEGQMGGPDFTVVAVNVDQAKLERPRQFLDEKNIKHLALYSDPSAKVLQDAKAFGLPTTLLIDRNGCQIGTMAGPAAWDSPDAAALLTAAKTPAG